MKQNQRQKKKRIDWRRVFVTALALLMALALMLPLLTTLFSGAHAVTQGELKDQIAGLEEDADAAKERKKDLQAQLKALEGDQARAKEKHSLLVRQLKELDGQIANTQSQIDLYSQLIAAQEVALQEAQDRESYAYQRFCQRARSMEESGTISYWSVLFAASDYADLLDRLALVDEIMKYDNSVVDELAQARSDVETTLAELNASKTGLDEQKAQLDLQRVEQADKVAEAQAVLDELMADQKELEALEKEARAEEIAIEKELAKKEKELEEMIKAAQFINDGKYSYPLPSQYTTITSRFGPREHPVTHKYNNHSGADISAPGGTEVRSVQAGVVITSAYSPSLWGEYVVISHGNGMTTLYAHMKRGSRKVKEGDVVSKGQLLGLVGATGLSTGNHLHLTLTIDGEKKDPLTTFWPNVTFDYRD